MSLPSTEIIDVSFSVPANDPEPALPIVLKGEHLRFIGWNREYTLIVNQNAITFEGPFQDDNPNAKEYYEVSRGIAGRWIEVRYGRIQLRIPGRGRWGINISDNPNFELQMARLITWMSQVHGLAAVRRVEEELTKQLYYWPTIFAFLQFLMVSGPAILVAIFGPGGAVAMIANVIIGVLFAFVFYAIGILKRRFGLWLGTLLNCGLLALPLLETWLVGERAAAWGIVLPIFVPFCLTPTAIMIPIAMSAYGYVLMEHPRLKRMIHYTA